MTHALTRFDTGRRAFLRHFTEMLIAMGLGMLVLGGAIEGALILGGTSLSDAPASVPAAVMALTMTVPMAWWMHHRGHARRHNLEMAASMVVPTAFAVGLYWLGALASHGVMMVQHVAMIPAMLGVMLWRYDHYSGRHGD